MPKETIMALDAAFGQASACLLRSDGRAYYATGAEALPHSQAILPLLEGLLDVAGLDWGSVGKFAIGTGPGSFTGLRVAAASLAGINAVLKRPALTFSSMAVTALQTDTNDLWVVEDARSGDAYIGHYVSGKATQAEQCLPWERIATLPISRYASQSDPDRDPIQGECVPLIHARPEALERMLIAISEDPETHAHATQGLYPMPLYIRPSQAERNASQG